MTKDRWLLKCFLSGTPATVRRYSMILNLMRVEGAEPAGLVQQSFRQFQVIGVEGGEGSVGGRLKWVAGGCKTSFATRCALFIP